MEKEPELEEEKSGSYVYIERRENRKEGKSGEWKPTQI